MVFLHHIWILCVQWLRNRITRIRTSQKEKIIIQLFYRTCDFCLFLEEEFEGHTEADAVSTSGKERTSESEESDLPTDKSKESPEAPSSVETEEREKESSNETTNDETSKSKTSGESDPRQDDTHALCKFFYFLFFFWLFEYPQ